MTRSALIMSSSKAPSARISTNQYIKSDQPILKDLVQLGLSDQPKLKDLMQLGLGSTH